MAAAVVLTFSMALVKASQNAPAHVRLIPGKGSYAVVVSAKTYGDDAWRKVVDVLVDKHQAATIIHDGPVAEARDALANVFPRYACFVARPEEADRQFVVAVHRLTRKLDDDPYTDAIWGILTGYEAADALRVAKQDAPLLIRRGGAGCGLDLGVFAEGRWYSEGEQNVMWEKLPGGSPQRGKCPDDTTADLVGLLNDYKAEFLMTSGHATTRDWQIGYSYRNGQFRCRGGQLFGLDLAGRRHDIRSPNPKVYLAAGNCLIGRIDDRECMALAFIRSAGICQLVGYVVSTWHGYGGWGTKELFVDQAGRFTFAEAFCLNGQALVHELHSRFPRTAGAEINEWDIDRDRTLLPRLAARIGSHDRDELGLLWDRDTVAFYGDPAWEARIRHDGELAWRQSLTEKDGVFTFSVQALRDGQWSRPPMALLPRRISEVKVTVGADLKPVITDNFILIPRSGSFAKGDSLEVTFEARKG